MQLDFREVDAAAIKVREKLRLGLAPVGDITAILADAGLAVFVRPLGEDGPEGLYLRRPSFAIVLLNGDAYLPRLRFTAAHELGHHERGATAVIDLTTGSGVDPEEKWANAFAASFLMPGEALAGRVSQGEPPSAAKVLEMANEFGVSYQVMVYRLHNLRLLRSGAGDRDRLLRERSVVFSGELRNRRLDRRTVLPADYTTRAIGAYEASMISLDRLAELLITDPAVLGRSLEEAGLLHPDDA